MWEQKKLGFTSFQIRLAILLKYFYVHLVFLSSIHIEIPSPGHLCPPPRVAANFQITLTQVDCKIRKGKWRGTLKRAYLYNQRGREGLLSSILSLVSTWERIGAGDNSSSLPLPTLTALVSSLVPRGVIPINSNFLFFLLLSANLLLVISNKDSGY